VKEAFIKNILSRLISFVCQALYFHYFVCLCVFAILWRMNNSGYRFQLNNDKVIDNDLRDHGLVNKIKI